MDVFLEDPANAVVTDDLLGGEPERHANQDLVDGLREMADFLEQHRELAQHTTTTLQLFPADLREVARAGYGKLEKHTLGEWYFLTRRFGSKVQIDFNQNRQQVCRRVLKEIKITPAQPERTVTLAAKPEEREEVYEWECPDSLLAEGQ